jgi:hypothetical protein
MTGDKIEKTLRIRQTEIFFSPELINSGLRKHENPG